MISLLAETLFLDNLLPLFHPFRRGESMGLDIKCPKCGSTRVQLSEERGKHGCLYFILFGSLYIIYLIFKWTVAFCILILFDWWIAIIKAIMGKGYVWKSLSLFSSRRKLYYCHSCGHNFRA